MLVDYFSGRTGKEVLANRRYEEVPYQLLKSAAWQQLASYITELNTFLALFTGGEEYKFDLYRYWQECATNGVYQIESMLLSNLEAKEKGSAGGQMASPAEFAGLLSTAGKFLQDIAAYETAEQLYQRALALTEQIHADNPDHPDIAQQLDGIMCLFC